MTPLEVDGLVQLAVAMAQSIRTRLTGQPAREARGDVVRDVPAEDVAFDVDEIAEQAINDHLRASGWSLACFTEHAGMQVFGRAAPIATLVIDPVDGSRPHLLGLNTAMVSIAIAAPTSAPTFRDVKAGVLLNIYDGTIMHAVRGAGAWFDGSPLRCRPRDVAVDSLFWSTEVAGRGASDLVAKTGPLIDASSRRGAMFLLNASAFCLSAIARGRLDAHVDVANALGTLGLFSYDVAAATLLLTEAGGVVTLPDGAPIEDQPLFDADGQAAGLSIVAASSASLHASVLGSLTLGVEARSA